MLEHPIPDRTLRFDAAMIHIHGRIEQRFAFQKYLDLTNVIQECGFFFNDFNKSETAIL